MPPTEKTPPLPLSQQWTDRAATSEYQPTPAYLRAQAAYYRQRAMRTSNPTEVEEYHCIADVFDRQAGAF
jgi:hypothetical protein